MLVEVMILALASTVRPTSLAAVSALLTRDARRRLMLAYVAGGLAFTVLFGVLVVTVFHGIHLHTGSNRAIAIADIIGGVAALLFGLALLFGVVGRYSARWTRRPDRARSSRLDQRITVRAAALVGPLTHIPGLFYLIALNVIVAYNRDLPGDLIAVGAYNAVWFAVPIAALVVCIADPDRAQTMVVAVQDRAKRHSRQIVLVASFAIGAILLIRGLLSI